MRRGTVIPVESFRLPGQGQGTLQARLRGFVASAVLEGRFRPGDRLPSTRALARHLGIARVTVVQAFTELAADDYLVSRPRSGWFVSDRAPPPAASAARRARAGGLDWSARLIRPAESLPAVAKPDGWQDARFPFVHGQPDPELFDHNAWRAAVLETLGRREAVLLGSDREDRDDPELVRHLLLHTLPRRGILAGPEEVLVTAGAQNALWLAAGVLLGPGRHAVHEEPCYPGLREILHRSGARVSAVPVDDRGLVVEAIPGDADVVFVTPSHQCPTVATMPAARRAALLARAGRDDFVIVEDDYDFDLAFLRPPAPALKSADRDGRVLQAGSLSKSMLPGLRLGWLVGPPPVIRAARALRAAMLRHLSGHLQRAAARFLALGHHDAHVARLGRALARRRQVLEEAIRTEGLEIAGVGVHGGSALWMRAPEGVGACVLARELAAEGVLIEEGSPFFAPGSRDPDAARCYRLGYGSIPEARIAEGVRRIASASRRLSRRPRPLAGRNGGR